MADYLRAIELDQGNTMAHYNAALIYRQTGQISNARQHEQAAGIELPKP